MTDIDHEDEYLELGVAFGMRNALLPSLILWALFAVVLWMVL